MPLREAGTSKGRRLQGFVLSYFGLGCLHHLLGGGHNFQLDASAASATSADSSTWPRALLECFVVAVAITAPFSGAETTIGRSSWPADACLLWTLRCSQTVLNDEAILLLDRWIE